MRTPPEREAEEARVVAAYARRDATVPTSRYSYFDPANLLLVQSRERRVLSLLDRVGARPLEERRVLEVGCGTGFWLREFIKWGADPSKLAGIDLLPERIASARRLCPEAVDLRCGSAAELPFADERFDVVLQSTLFTSVLDPAMQRRIAAEMTRVLSPRGVILWYDFRVDNPRNRDVRGVRAAEIRALFPSCDVSLAPITLAPPLARTIAPWSRLVCSALEAVPLLCTHYLGAIRKR